MDAGCCLREVCSQRIKRLKLFLVAVVDESALARLTNCMYQKCKKHVAANAKSAAFVRGARSAYSLCVCSGVSVSDSQGSVCFV